MNKVLAARLAQRAAAVGLGFALTAGSAMAAIDTTGVTAGIDEAKAAVAVVGAAGLLVVVGVKVYRWIRAAL